SFVGGGGGRLLPLRFSGPAGFSLALRPASSLSRRSDPFSPKALTISFPPPPLRLLPAGTTELPGGSRTHGTIRTFTRRTYLEGSLESVSKFGHFGLTGRSESLIRRTRVCRQKIHGFCLVGNSLKWKRTQSITRPFPKSSRNVEKLSPTL